MSLSALPRLTSLPDPSTTSISRGIKDVFAKSAKAVVKVRGTDEHGEFAGTGFFIDPIGTLYTAFSVAGEADSLSVDSGGKKEPARVLLADSRSGIVLLKVDIATPMLPIGKSEQVEVATPVHVDQLPAGDVLVGGSAGHEPEVDALAQRIPPVDPEQPHRARD